MSVDKAGYRIVEITASVPAEQVLDDDFDTIWNFIHDLYRDRAITEGRQVESDCGDWEGPGCEGCNLVMSVHSVTLDEQGNEVKRVTPGGSDA